MTVNLITPFILRLVILQVNEIPKFMAESPVLDHHSRLVPNTDIRLPMSLKVIISYLRTRILSSNEISNVMPTQTGALS